MTDLPKSSIALQLVVLEDHVLKGLDLWLKEGILTEDQVREFCSSELSCCLKEHSLLRSTLEPVGTQVSEPVFSEISRLFPPLVDPEPKDPSATERSLDPGEVVVKTVASSPIKAENTLEFTQKRDVTPNQYLQFIQAMMTELSIRWVLFLGLFLVVVSSSVLALSQWNRLTASGQYSLLFGYTIAFGGIGLWTSRQSNLTLTSRSLMLTSVLLMPVNFWAMDSLKLWSDPIGWITALGTATVLSRVAFQLLPSLRTDNNSFTFNFRWIWINGLILSVLQWGWQGSSFYGVVAIYLGVISTLIILLKHFRLHHSEYPLTLELFFTFGYGIIILFLRGILSDQIPLASLGLAFGISGWGILSLFKPSSFVWVGIGCLGWGWGISIGAEVPWQACLVSGLLLQILWQELQHRAKPRVVLALLLVGLQTYILVGRLFPDVFWSQGLALAESWFGSRDMLYPALIGISGLPYLGLIVGFSHWLSQGKLSHDSDPHQLARTTEIFGLALAGLLFSLSCGVTGIRFISLCGVSLSCLWIFSHRPQPSEPSILAIHIHSLGLVTLLDGLDWVLPNLPQATWASLLLGGMVGEWFFAFRTQHSAWRKSAWILGGILSGIGYMSLLLEINDGSLLDLIAPALVQVLLMPIGGILIPLFDQHYVNEAWIWILTPMMLTLAPYLAQSAIRSTESTMIQKWTTWAAFGTVLALQGLTLENESLRLFGLVSGSVLMLLTLRQVQSYWISMTGIGLTWIALNVYYFQTFDLTLAGLLLSWVTEVWILWGLRRWVLEKPGSVARLLSHSFRYWGILLTVLSLIGLIIQSSVSLVNGFETSATYLTIITTLVLIGSLVFRLLSGMTNLGFYGLMVCVEILLVNTLGLYGSGSSWVYQVGMGNLGLGLVTQLAGDIWIYRSQERGSEIRRQFSSLVGIPLIFAGLGWIQLHITFTELSCFASFVVTLVGIGIGRRYPVEKGWMITCLYLLSMTVYETAFWAALQGQGGKIGDLLILFAFMGITITWILRFLPQAVLDYLRLQRSDLQIVSHSHWFITTLFLLITPAMPVSGSMTYWGCGIAAATSLYPCWLGRKEDPNPEELSWLYVGMIEMSLTSFWCLDLLFPSTDLRLWLGGIYSVIALGLHQIPWDYLGWPTQPWRRVATILPMIFFVLTFPHSGFISLGLGIIFYGWMSYHYDQIRLSYLSLFLGVWAFYRLIDENSWNLILESYGIIILSYISPITCAVLYGTHVDPFLQGTTARSQRHILRLITTGILCLTAFLDLGDSFWGGAATIVLGLVLLIAGLGLRIRAFLFSGAMTFMVTVVRQIAQFSFSNSVLLWSCGILLGIILLWVGATFEARRSQISQLWIRWVTELAEWE
jgi:hypothetical protein